MKKPIAAPAATDLEVPLMPVPPHGGSFVLDEEANTLTHVPLPVEGAVEHPVKPEPEEAR